MDTQFLRTISDRHKKIGYPECLERLQELCQMERAAISNAFQANRNPFMTPESTLDENNWRESIRPRFFSTHTKLFYSTWNVNTGDYVHSADLMIPIIEAAGVVLDQSEKITGIQNVKFTKPITGNVNIFVARNAKDIPHSAYKPSSEGSLAVLGERSSHVYFKVYQAPTAHPIQMTTLRNPIAHGLLNFENYEYEGGLDENGVPEQKFDFPVASSKIGRYLEKLPSVSVACNTYMDIAIDAVTKVFDKKYPPNGAPKLAARFRNVTFPHMEDFSKKDCIIRVQLNEPVPINSDFDSLTAYITFQCEDTELGSGECTLVRAKNAQASQEHLLNSNITNPNRVQPILLKATPLLDRVRYYVEWILQHGGSLQLIEQYLEPDEWSDILNTSIDAMEIEYQVKKKRHKKNP